MEATNKAIEDAMRADFQSWSPQSQDKMLNLLQQADQDNYDWWVETLVGKLPNSVDEIV